MSSWEETLKQHLSALLPDASSSWAERPLWDPFGKTSKADATAQKQVQHRLPSFFGKKDWDLGRGHIKDASSISSSSSANSFPQSESHRKVPCFFHDQEWGLGGAVRADLLSDMPQVPKPEVSTVSSRQRRCTFCLKPSDRFGMVLEETTEPMPGGLLVVTGVDACSAFARTAGGTCGLAAGDVIVEVNGRLGSVASLREMLLQRFAAHGQKLVEVVVRSRPPTFNIDLRREGKQKIGMAAAADLSNPECLLVESIRPEGLVPAWNAAHGSMRICKGDLITHVNGVSGDVAAMKKQIQQGATKGSALCLRIVTPAGQVVGCQKADAPEATVPWDMQVRWLDDSLSDVSTACYSSNPSGTRTPEDTCLSGTRTPEEHFG